MNKAILIGNLANDPESRITSSGIPTCKFQLAVQRRYSNQQGAREVDFLPIVCWRATAELCSKYLSKGRKVAVEGSIQTRSYDAQDGSKRYVTEIIADNVEFLSSREESAAPTAQPDVVAAAEKVFGANFTEVEDDELPF